MSWRVRIKGIKCLEEDGLWLKPIVEVAKAAEKVLKLVHSSFIEIF